MSIISVVRDFFTHPVQVVASPSPGVTNPPDSWSQVLLGPGRPVQPMLTYDQDIEPRTMDYNPQVNAIITTRTGYGLMAFTELKAYNDNTPEAATYRRLIIEEIKMLVPQIKDASGELVHDPDLQWMTISPDGRHDWQTWLAKWLDSVINYDAGALFRVKTGGTTHKIEKGRAGVINDWRALKNGDVFTHTGGRTTALRVIDGSTIFPIITENGDEPLSPLPAFAQTIKGLPYLWMTRDQLWYRPRHERGNAPYGIANVEDCLGACRTLQQFWAWVEMWYTWGTSTDDEKTAPSGWTSEQVLEWQRLRADMLRGNPAARQESQYFPDGFKQLTSKGVGQVAGQREKDYIAARNTVALAFGIPPSERGDAPSEGFGGKSWHEGGTDAFARQVLIPFMGYVALPFNDILWNERGFRPDEIHFELSFPSATIDPEEEEKKTLARWEKRLITRNEARENIGLTTREGPDGDEYFEPSAQNLVEEEGGGTSSLFSPGQTIPVVNNDTVTITGNGHGSKLKVIKILPEQAVKPKRLTKAQRSFFKHCGVCIEDDTFFGTPVSRSVPVSFPSFVSNELEIVAISDEKLGQRAAVWRPESGEKASHQEWVGGLLYPREEAVYLLDRAMELYLVPVSFVTELDSKMGVVVHYVKGRDPARYADRYDEEWVDKAGLLDYISGQTDRRADNWLTHPDDDGRPILVDNALSFIDEQLERPFKSPFTVILVSKPLSDEIKDLLYLVINNCALWEDLAGLVGDEVVNQAKARAMSLYELEQKEIEVKAV